MNKVSPQRAGKPVKGGGKIWICWFPESQVFGQGFKTLRECKRWASDRAVILSGKIGQKYIAVTPKASRKARG